MSALPCPVADAFAAADQAYAAITEFLRSEEAWQVKHSELERQLEGMGRELMRKLLQAHLELRQPGQAVEAGALVCVIEAMKMENEITAHKAGTIAEIPIAVGAAVANGDKLAVITSPAPAE